MNYGGASVGLIGFDRQVILPTFHADQARAYGRMSRYFAVRCGRRWGKTVFGATLACDAVCKGQSVGFFAPDYRIVAETFHEIASILEPIRATSSKTEGVFRATTGGRIDYWTLENERAGRSRRYHLALVDEGAFTKSNMAHLWTTAIKPTLLDYQGRAVVMSNTNGVDQDNFFYQICNDKSHGFTEFHAPTHANPDMPRRWPGEPELAYQLRRQKELDDIKASNHPLVYKQEYLAEFVDWGGVQFFALADMLDHSGQPFAPPVRCDAVFATIDSATKAGKEHDGTAVCYWAFSKNAARPLMLIDWDIVQIEGALLEVWIPTVLSNLEAYARAYGSRAGSLGAFIEDKASGMVLLQHAPRRGWPLYPIDSKFTALGKEERAISVSGYVYQKKVGVTAHAHDKTVNFKDKVRNHWMTQFLGFRIGVKDQEDDLADATIYGIALTLGGSGGF